MNHVKWFYFEFIIYSSHENYASVENISVEEGLEIIPSISVTNKCDRCNSTNTNRSHMRMELQIWIKRKKAWTASNAQRNVWNENMQGIQTNMDGALFFCLFHCFVSWDPFYKHGLTLIPAWISNHTSSKVWDEITYPILNFNGWTVEGYEWISNFIPHIITDVITYPCWD